MRSIVLGSYLGARAIRRTALITKIFIIMIMMLAFLNLLVVRGILVGIPDSSVESTRANETGDVLISQPDGEAQITNTIRFLNYLDRSDLVEAYSVRYSITGVIESDLTRSRKEGVRSSTRSANVIGIDPEKEDVITNISSFISDGRMVRSGESGALVIGQGLLDDAATASFTGENLLQNVFVGSRILMTINGRDQEFRVVGIISAKGSVDNRVILPQQELRRLIGSVNLDASEIGIKTVRPELDIVLANELRDLSFAPSAKIQTAQEAVGAFVEDIKIIFSFLSTFVGLIGIMITAVTIFIIIFVNIVSRTQEIGIFRAVGIPSGALTFSYILQALFYGICGIIVSLAIFFLLLVPFFIENPIDFPFADISLSVDLFAIGYQVAILVFASILSGYIPARMVMKRDTLSLILGQ